jgi:hypothetical protein
MMSHIHKVTLNRQGRLVSSCMNITKEKCDEFKDYVEHLIDKYKMNKGVAIENLLIEFYLYASSISQQYISQRYLEGHNTGVNPAEMDFSMIMMSIISICWAVRMRKIKSEEGQCHKHTNCEEARTFHRERYDEWINVIEETLKALRSDRPSVEQNTKVNP